MALSSSLKLIPCGMAIALLIALSAEATPQPTTRTLTRLVLTKAASANLSAALRPEPARIATRQARRLNSPTSARRLYLRAEDGRVLILRKRSSRGSSTTLDGSRITTFSGSVRSGGTLRDGEFFLTMLSGQSLNTPQLRATIRNGDLAHVLTIANGSHTGVLEAISQPKLGGCAGTASLEPAGGASSPEHHHSNHERLHNHPPADLPATTTASLDSSPGVQSLGSTVDVLIVFSPAAWSAAGGSTGAATEAAQAIASTNTALSNSGLPDQVRLAGVRQLAQAETGDINSQLNAIYNPSDGLYDDAVTARNELGADMISMFVNTATYNGSSVCGLGVLLQNFSAPYADQTITVVDRDCATSNLSFAHELGHNWGAQHDLANATSGGVVSYGAFSYSFGHRFTGTNAVQYRSVLAYSPGSRIAYFSNPDITYQGTATGTSSANNALTLAQTVPQVAAFYDPPGEATPVPSPSATTSPPTGQPTVAPTTSPTHTPTSPPEPIATVAPGRPIFSGTTGVISGNRCRVSGTVIGANSRLPVASSRIRVNSNSLTRSARSSALGAFEVSVPKPRSGRVTVTATVDSQNATKQVRCTRRR